MFDLPSSIYNALQKFVHGEYEKERNLIESFLGDKDGMIIEFGCGTGLLSKFFRPGKYVGVDVDADRVANAKEMHPEHEFEVKDVTVDSAEYLQRFDVVFCNNVIHHIDDGKVATLLQNVRAASVVKGKAIELLMMEPLLPKPLFANVPGYLLAKMDRGRHVRTFDAMMKLFGSDLLRFEKIRPDWHWPVPGIVMNLSVQ